MFLLFIQIQNEELAQSLGLSTGKYSIKSTTCQQRSKKGFRKSPKDTQLVSSPRNNVTDSGEAGSTTVSNSVVQTSDFEELIDTQKLIEFAITSLADSKDMAEISDFEPVQMLGSSYLEGPVIKIDDYAGSMTGMSDAGTSSAEDDTLLCYMAQSSESATSNAAAVLDSTEQALMQTAAHSSALMS